MEQVVPVTGKSSGATLPDNPFRPGFGMLPSFLAGRDRETDHTRTLVRRLQVGEQISEAALRRVPRGNGKTALIGWLESEAGDKLNQRRIKAASFPTRRRSQETCTAATRTKASRRRRTERRAEKCPGIDGPGGIPGKPKRVCSETERKRGCAGMRRAPRATQNPGQAGGVPYV